LGLCGPPSAQAVGLLDIIIVNLALKENQVEKAVFAVAKSETQAVAICDDLKAAGFSNNDVSVLFPDKAGTRDFAHEQHT
jgi:hypothetical protein